MTIPRIEGAAGAAFDGGGPPGAAWMEDARRIKELQPRRVVEALGIKPGMSILDVGAGRGVFSFLFADALDGAGMVYATDVEPGYVDDLRAKAESRGCRNVTPVLVSAEGLDPFYAKHRFDIIFASALYHHLDDPRSFFRQLRPSLAERGRLVIVHNKTDPGMREAMFEDFSGVVRRLAAPGAAPILRRMGPLIRAYVADRPAEPAPEAVKREVLEGTEAMLEDRRLVPDAAGAAGGKLHASLAETDALLYKWLLYRLGESGVFASSAALSGTNLKMLRRINRLVLIDLLGLKRLGAPDSPGAPAVVEKNSVIRTLEQAGYVLLREHPFMKTHHFMEFGSK